MAAAARPRKKATKKVILPATLPIGFTVDDMFKNKWVIGDRIGSGGCGVIYLVSDGRKTISYDYVMKVEFHENGPLYTEMHFYRNIGRPEQIEEWARKNKLPYLGMSACHGLGSFEHNGSKCRFLVLQRYGTDLQNYLDEHNTFSAKVAYTIALATVDVLEYLHSCKYIHGDVKAANLLLGRKKGTENQVYLVDMGLATKYITASGHRKETPDPKKAHNGTIEFTSRDSHRGTPCTRRSDFETLAYNLLLWLSGSLPWVGMTDVKKVAKLKEEHMADIRKFVQNIFGTKTPPGIMEYLAYVQELGFEEEPDYDTVRKIFINAIQKSGAKNDRLLHFGAERESRQKSSPKKKSPATTKKKSPASTHDSESASSSKENLALKQKEAKGGARPKRKREVTPITLDPGIKPTPAMLEILNKRK